MTARKTAALALLLGLLCALAAFLFWKADRVENTRPLKSVQASEAAKVIIDRAGESLTLEKKEGRWLLTAPVSDLADAQVVEDLLSGLLQLSVGAEVSRDVAGYGAYDLTESSAARVRLYLAADAAPALDGYFGKNALGYDSLYFRFAREKPVYFSSGVSPYHIGRSADDFREHALSSVERDALQKIKITARKESLELNKSSSGWVSSSGALTAEKIDSIISGFLNLKVAAFADAADAASDAGLDKPLFTAELSGSVKTTRFAVGKVRAEKEGKFLFRYARVEGRDALLLISFSDVEALVKLYN